jgi:ribonuclease-3
MAEAVEELECRLGYSFRDRKLLEEALTHRSWVSEKGEGREGSLSNERLEFLGDAVLGLIVSEILLERHPRLSEGRLSQFKARLVSARHLQEKAQQLELGAHLQLGRGEEASGGRGKPNLLANALEALIGAIYLDGGLAGVRAFIERHIATGADLSAAGPERDFKSRLQEFAQTHGLPPPRYRTVAASGPDHSKVFTVEVAIGEHLSAQADGRSLKAAGQRAAEILLGRLTEEQRAAG